MGLALMLFIAMYVVAHADEGIGHPFFDEKGSLTINDDNENKIQVDFMAEGRMSLVFRWISEARADFIIPGKDHIQIYCKKRTEYGNTPLYCSMKVYENKGCLLIEHKDFVIKDSRRARWDSIWRSFFSDMRHNGGITVRTIGACTR